MNQIAVGEEIATTIPGLKKEISRAISSKNSYALIRVLTKYCQKMVEQHQEETVEKCFRLVGLCYSKGDTVVKNAIENVFVFSLDSILFSCSSTERKKILSQIPTGLYKAYLKQIYSSGI